MNNSLIEEHNLPLSVLGNIDYADVLSKDILELIGQSGLSEEEKIDLYEKMAATIESRALLTVAEKLSKEEIETINNLQDDEVGEIDEIYKRNNINIREIIAQEALIYKAHLVTLLQKK